MLHALLQHASANTFWKCAPFGQIRYNSTLCKAAEQCKHTWEVCPPFLQNIPERRMQNSIPLQTNLGDVHSFLAVHTHGM